MAPSRFTEDLTSFGSEDADVDQNAALSNREPACADGQALGSGLAVLNLAGASNRDVALGVAHTLASGF